MTVFAIVLTMLKPFYESVVIESVIKCINS